MLPLLASQHIKFQICISSYSMLFNTNQLFFHMNIFCRFYQRGPESLPGCAGIRPGEPRPLPG